MVCYGIFWSGQLVYESSKGSTLTHSQHPQKVHTPLLSLGKASG